MLAEIPLILFTLLSQLAVGMFGILTVSGHIIRKTDDRLAASMARKGAWVTEILMIAGLATSFFHLGKPSHAVYAITNWGTAWLAREIICATLFTVLGAVLLFCLKKGLKSLSTTIAWINMAVGLALIYAEAGVYASSIIPAWTSLSTFLSFYLSALLMGSAGAITVMMISAREIGSLPPVDLIKKLSWVAAAAGMLILIAFPVYVSALQNAGDVGRVSAGLLLSGYGVINAVRYTCAALAAVLIVMLAYKQLPNSKNPQSVTTLLLGSLLLAVAGETIGRFIFYAIGVPLGIG